MISLYASLLVNLLLLVGLITLWRKRSGTSKKPEVTLTKDANELLAELLNGGAVCVTQIIDPNQIFYYSPKDR